MFRVFLTLLVCALLPRLAAGAESDWLVTSESQTVESGDCDEIRVVNLFGEIRVRGLAKPEVEVLGAVQRHADDPRSAVTSVREEGGVVAVEVRYEGPADLPSPVPDAWRKRRVDLTLFVPATCALRLETRHERIAVKRMAAAVSAISETGALSLATFGQVTARSGSGAIRAVFGATAWQGEAELVSVSGEIRAVLPVDADLEAFLETTGELASDYSMEVAWSPEDLTKRGRLTVGEGRRTLRLRSGRGDLKVVRDVSSLLASRQQTSEALSERDDNEERD